MGTELKNVIKVWPDVKHILSVPRNQRQYKKLVGVMDELVDEVGENEKHPLQPLLETIGSLIESYERGRFHIQGQGPIETLKFLMHEHNFTQKDLGFIGSQGVVSEILSGKRRLNTRQIKALSERFGVSPAAFL